MASSKTPETRPGVAAQGPRSVYVLRLFVAGMTARSTRAVDNIRALCVEHLAGTYELEVINLYERPALAGDEQIIAAPPCVKRFPLPERRVIGDMSDSARVLVGL